MLTRNNIASFYSQFTNDANILNEYAEMDVLQLRERADTKNKTKFIYQKRLKEHKKYYVNNETANYYEDIDILKAIKREIRHLNTLIVRKINALGGE